MTAAKTFTPFAHQTKSQPFLDKNPYVFDTSDCGTGKTLNHLMWYNQKRVVAKGKKIGKMLVIATKSILDSAWGADILKCFPHLKFSIAWAENREEAFKQAADIYITNHDAVNWLVKQKPAFFKDFDVLVVDESTAFKTPTSGRSKNIGKIVKHFKYRRLLTGTPMPRSVVDIWHQVFLLDSGKSLGGSYYAFRNVMCDSEQVGKDPNARKWTDKEHAYDAVMDLIRPFTMRWLLDECHDIPDNHMYTVPYELPRKARAAYNQMAQKAMLEVKEGKVTAAHAAVLRMKLLQIASGSVYTETGATTLIDDGRYELVLDLAGEAKHSVVFFWWTHQRDALVAMAEKRGLTYGVFDGSTSSKVRKQITADFQAGKLDVIFAHPQSAGHGLTWTKGTRTIFTNPGDNWEYIKQALHRIYRAGQKHKTETIIVTATGTMDEVVAENMMAKDRRQTSALAMMKLHFDAWRK